MFSEDIFKEQTGLDFNSFYKEYNPKLIYYKYLDINKSY